MKVVLAVLFLFPALAWAGPLINVQEDTCAFLNPNKNYRGYDVEGALARGEKYHHRPGDIDFGSCDNGIVDHHDNGNASCTTYETHDVPSAFLPVKRDFTILGRDHAVPCVCIDKDGNAYVSYEWEQRVDVEKRVIFEDDKNGGYDNMTGKRKKEIPDRKDTIRIGLSCISAYPVKRAHAE